MKGATLAIDLGKRCTGWALLRDTRLLAYDRATFTKQTVPQMYDGMERVLGKAMAHASRFGLSVGTIAFEAAEHQKGKAQEAYCTLATCVRVFAGRNSIRAAKVYPGSVKKIMTNNGGASKEEMVEAVNQTFKLGFSPAKTGTDHNVADAIAIGLTAYTLDALGELDYV